MATLVAIDSADSTYTGPAEDEVALSGTGANLFSLTVSDFHILVIVDADLTDGVSDVHYPCIIIYVYTYNKYYMYVFNIFIEEYNYNEL